MRQTLQSIANQDGSARFKNTFVNLFVNNTAKGLTYISSVSEERVECVTSEGGLRLPITEKQLVEVEVVMPHASWKQMGRNAALFLRKPARQWRRSLSDSTHSITYDFEFTGYGTAADEAAIHAARWPQISHSHLKDLSSMLSVSPCVDFTQALEQLKDNMFSVVLSDNMMLNKNGHLFNGKLNIAKIFFKQKSYKVHPLFAEELRDLTRGCGYKAIEEADYGYSK